MVSVCGYSGVGEVVFTCANVCGWAKTEAFAVTYLPQL